MVPGHLSLLGSTLNSNFKKKIIGCLGIHGVKDGKAHRETGTSLLFMSDVYCTFPKRTLQSKKIQKSISQRRDPTKG